MARLNTIRGHMLAAVAEWSKAHEKWRAAEHSLVVCVSNLCEADPDIEGFDLTAALKSAEKYKKQTRGKGQS